MLQLQIIGVYIEPTFYTKISSSNGKTILESKQKKKRVFSEAVACVLTQLLTEPVNGSSGTATYCAISGIDVAAKTGTTNENYDRWLCGYTPYYTAVCWYGFDMNETINYNGKNPAGLMWSSVMSQIHANLASASFEISKSVVTATICKDSGCVANPGCTDTYTEYFLKGTVPDTCSQHSSSSSSGSGTTKSTTNSSSSSDSNSNTSQDFTENISNDSTLTDQDTTETTDSIRSTTNTTTNDNTTQNKISTPTNATTPNNTNVNSSTNTTDSTITNSSFNTNSSTTNSLDNTNTTSNNTSTSE